MKYLRIGNDGSERPAVLDADGNIRDLSGIVPDIDGATIASGALSSLRLSDVDKLPIVEGERIGPCLARPVNMVCIGLNYVDHAREGGLPVPSEPIIFLKSLSSYCGPNDAVRLPQGARKVDWEVELGVVIGKRASNVSEAAAMDHVAGYCVVNDVSEREFQLDLGGTWDKGKGCDTFGPTGPWFVTADEVPDPQALRMWLDVDGQRMQDGTTRDMIFGVRELISYVSRFITLHPGDIVATGTPAGVGHGMKPEPVYLKAGQSMTLGIEGLGQQCQQVVG